MYRGLGFPNIRGTFLGVPKNKDCNSILGTLIFGKHYIHSPICRRNPTYTQQTTNARTYSNSLKDHHDFLLWKEVVSEMRVDEFRPSQERFDFTGRKYAPWMHLQNELFGCRNPAEKGLVLKGECGKESL